MDDLKRDKGAITLNEKKMILSTHKYFFEYRQGQKQPEHIQLRKLVAKVLGIGEATVAQVIAEGNKSENKQLTAPKLPGRPRKELKPNVSEVIRDLVMSANSAGLPLSTPVLRQKLEEEGHKFSKWQLLRILHVLGYFYGHGERRNILHESAENVAFRGRYLRWRFSNLQGNNSVPVIPEVFLDESYCHLNHTTNYTWVPSHGIVCIPGHGPLLVIFGAIIVMRNGNTNKLEGEIVPNSLLIWDPSIKPPSLRGRKRLNADEWENIPDTIRNANLVADQSDYHGNFNAEIFEDLFEKLCAGIKDRYGPVCIHMDGARYHKRRAEQVPTSKRCSACMVGSTRYYCIRKLYQSRAIRVSKKK